MSHWETGGQEVLGAWQVVGIASGSRGLSLAAWPTTTRTTSSTASTTWPMASCHIATAVAVNLTTLGLMYSGLMNRELFPQLSLKHQRLGTAAKKDGAGLWYIVKHSFYLPGWCLADVQRVIMIVRFEVRKECVSLCQRIWAVANMKPVGDHLSISHLINSLPF